MLLPVSTRELLAQVGAVIRLRQMQKALRESEERFRLLAENATDVVWMADLELNPIYITPSVERLRGYTAEEALEQSMEETLTPESWRRAHKAFEEGWALETSEDRDPTRVRTLELEYKRKDGSTVWAESKMSYLRDQNRIPIAIVGVTRDISARKRAEDALRRERDLLDRVMETSPVGITLIDRQGQIIFANAQAERVLGLGRDEIVQRAYNAPAWRITDYEGGPFPDEQLPFRRVMDAGEVVMDVRHAIDWPDGRRKLLSINAAPLLNSLGEIEGIVAALEDVTERVAADGAVRQSERKFRSIFEAMPMGMYTYRLEEGQRLVLTDYNSAAEEILGIKGSELQGKTFESAFPEVRGGEPAEQFRRIAVEGGIWHVDEFEYEDERFSGIFDVLAFQTTQDNVVVAFQDITERKQAAEDLRRHTEQLEALREAWLDLTTELNLDVLLHSIVSRAMELLDCTVGGLYLHQPDRDVLELAVIIGMEQDVLGVGLQRGEGLAGRIWETGEPLVVDDYGQWEGRSAAFEGRNLAAVAGVPVYWSEEFLGVLDLAAEAPGVFAQDDAELLELFAAQASIAIKNAQLFRAEQGRRQEAEALRQASLVLGRTLDQDVVLGQLLKQIGTVIAYDGANVMWIEDGMARISHHRGYEQAGTAEAISSLCLPVAEIPGLHQMATSHQPCLVPDTRKDPTWVRLDVTGWIYSWAGAPIVVRDEVVAFLCLDSATPGYYSTEHQDLLAAFAAHAAVAIENAQLLSETQLAYKELQKAQAQLVQSAKMAAVGELAAGVAHELNNPLTSVLGFAQVLMRSISPDDPGYENLVTIAQEALRARDIVRDLLVFSQQTASTQELADVNEVIRNTLSLIRRQFETSGVAVQENLADDLPTLFLATGRIKQVFLNLFTNALQAMPNGGRLMVSSRLVEDEVLVRIADTGSGIPEEHLSRIFEPFFTTKPVGQGTGLGLSVSLGIVQEHGGRIEVESLPGEGSTVGVWLPVTAGFEEAGDGE
jgi:PAS domain S-box-containing protein